MSSHYAARNDEGQHRIGTDEPLAIRLLKEEHHIFRRLFDDAEAAEDAPRRLAIATELCLRLSVHMTIEEELLYPALTSVIGEEEVNEGIVEHASGKRLIAEIEQLDGDEALYKDKLHAPRRETIHHIDEEDEELFATRSMRTRRDRSISTNWAKRCAPGRPSFIRRSRRPAKRRTPATPWPMRCQAANRLIW